MSGKIARLNLLRMRKAAPEGRNRLHRQSSRPGIRPRTGQRTVREGFTVIRMRVALSLCVLLGVASDPATAAAQDNFETLLQRLQGAERRIQELESQNLALPRFETASFADETGRNADESSETEEDDDADAKETFEERLKKLEEGW